MVFSSHIFIFYFLPLSLLLYYTVPRSWRMPVLTLVSYAFYGWTNPWFVLLIMWSTSVDFICGNLIYGHWRLIGQVETQPDGSLRASATQRKLFVALSLISNIGMLCFFKYFMFAQENLNAMLAMAGKEQMRVLVVLLPAGISFYTFESISYVLDIYYGRAKPASVWVDSLVRQKGVALDSVWSKIRLELQALNAFACYITQFPHLVAGPIIRYQDMEAQLHHRSHTLDKFARGIFIFSLGLAKKVLLANPMGQIADAAFQAGALHWYDAWYGIFGYAFQIYFDFSGYSDMAIGLGLMFGFEFAKNFDSPYKSKSITEFWRRWHISLSSWLRDYLYIPLGGNRKGEPRTYVNLIAVMVIGGFWHGASWTFLIWGAIHGAWLALERLMGKDGFYSKAPAPVRVAITFIIVNIGWVFFRAETLPVGIKYAATLFSFQSVPPATSLLIHPIYYSADHVVWMLIAIGIAFFGVQTWDLSKRLTPIKTAMAVGLLAWSVVALSTQTFNPFLYFRF